MQNQIRRKPSRSPDLPLLPSIEPMSQWPTSLLGGLPITRCSMETAANGFVAQALWARGRHEKPFYSTSANGQVIAACAQDATMRSLILEADQIHADGMPMVLFSRLVSQKPVTERIATTDLVHAVAEKAAILGLKFYFLGGTAEINQQAVDVMRHRYPGLLFSGHRSGYFSPKDEGSIAEDIVSNGTDILWVGMGFPLEQKFLSRNMEKLRGVGVVKTSGGLFDFISGKNQRAPEWMQRAGLEWAYRMYLEPRRLAVRYFKTNPVALYELIRHSE